MSRVAAIASLIAIWLMLQGSLDPWVGLFGLYVASLVLILSKPLALSRANGRPPRFELRLWAFTVLVGVFLWELMVSSLQVVREVFRPRIRVEPAILRYPLQVESDLQILMLSSLISLTPGTLSLEVSPDRQILYIHVLSVDGDGTELVRSIHQRLERAVLRAVR